MIKLLFQKIKTLNSLKHPDKTVMDNDAVFHEAEAEKGVSGWSWWLADLQFIIRDWSLFMEYTGSGKIDPWPRNFLLLFARAMKFI